MQVPSIPPPIVTNALSQDVVAKAVPHVQAVAPLVQNAVAPTPKAEKSNQSRSDKEKGRGSREENKEQNAADGEKDEHSVNISV